MAFQPGDDRHVLTGDWEYVDIDGAADRLILDEKGTGRDNWESGRFETYTQRWPPLFGQNVLFFKWRLAVFCLRGGEPWGQVVNIHSIRRVSVKRPMRPDLVVERQVPLQALVGGADGLVGV